MLHYFKEGDFQIKDTRLETHVKQQEIQSRPLSGLLADDV